MNINKLLCKYLDRDGKGYVTMGNLVTATSGFGALSIIVLGYMRGATTIMEYWDGNVSTTLASALNDANIIGAICIPFTIAGTGLLIVIILAVVIAVLWCAVEDVWAVKIAKCERKDGD